MNISTLDILQWMGCITGAAGSLLLAVNIRQSGWGFVLFLISNGFWAAYGLQTGAPGLITNQAFFTVTSILGIYRWKLSPARQPTQNNQNQDVKYKLEAR